MKTNTEVYSETDCAAKVTHEALLNWDLLCRKIIDIFRLSDDEALKLYESRPARLVASLPYVAGCQEPDRTAFGHLCLYVAEIRSGNGCGDHNPDDESSVFSRLRMIMNFSGGDARIIEHGMAILALVMINGYYRSRESDAEREICNPFNDGSWDYEALSTELVQDISKYPCKTLDEILPVFYAVYTAW